MIVSTKLILAVLAFDAAIAAAARAYGPANVLHGNIFGRDGEAAVTVTATDCNSASGPAPSGPATSAPAPSAPATTVVSVSVPDVTSAVPTGRPEAPITSSAEHTTTGPSTEAPPPSMSTPVSETKTSVVSHETPRPTRASPSETVATPTPSAMASRHVGFNAVLAGVIGAAIFAAL
ncbi:TPA_exp: Uncharacterized protein A8136_4205 [Trichophyton benhamiae CBS 112371]|nr:TPA_exp: Uncharacterized protein A8136_4205 [Trichophyton benhamiae CBS 112371]